MRVLAACGGPLASRHVALPTGMHRLPGPAWLVAERCVSPWSGPYVSLRVWVPSRRGARFLFWPAVNVVSAIDARLTLLTPEAAPAPATLRWWADASSVEVIWEEKDLKIRARSVAPRLVRLAKVEIGVPGDAATEAWLAGRHLGLIMSALQPVAGWAPAVRWRVARRRRAAEPALTGRSGAPVLRGYSSPSRAYSSVG